MLISSERVIAWMNVIRDTTGKEQYRILENFWESQIKSKIWILEQIKELRFNLNGNIYIFGGWYGVLAQLLVDTFPKIQKVYSVDSDPNCKYYGLLLSNNDYKIHFVTNDMKNFTQYENPKLIINTSTEHVESDVFENWLESVPENIPVVLQGNDFFHCDDHIRCSNDLEQFKEMNSLSEYFFEGRIYCPGNFYRFMTIGVK